MMPVISLHRFYHGHVEQVADTYSGQIGPLIIYEKGVLNGHGLPKVNTIITAVSMYCLLAFVHAMPRN